MLFVSFFFIIFFNYYLFIFLELGHFADNFADPQSVCRIPASLLAPEETCEKDEETHTFSENRYGPVISGTSELGERNGHLFCMLDMLICC